MTGLIHPTAIISPKAQLADDVSVGAFAVIGEHASIDSGTCIASHVVIDGRTHIGQHNQIHAHAVIGGVPQDKKYRKQHTRLIIGDHNTIREFCTINLGTAEGIGETRVGNHNWIMAYVHVAHDCVIANQCIFANGVQLAGHVEIDDYVVLGGMTGVHQFCKIGAHVMASVSSVITQDVVPFLTVSGQPLSVHGLNSTGLKRRGFEDDDLAFLKQIHKLLFRRALMLDVATQAIEQLIPANEQQQNIRLTVLSFLERTDRGIAR